MRGLGRKEKGEKDVKGKEKEGRKRKGGEGNPLDERGRYFPPIVIITQYSLGLYNWRG